MLRHRRLVDVDSARNSSSSKSSRSMQRQDRQQARLVRSDEEEEAEADDVATIDDLEDQWRQAAQMLTDDDELLLAGASDNTVGNSGNRNQHHHQPRQTSGGRRQHQQFGGRSTPTPITRRGQLAESDELQGYSDDDSSSISFAQSGCHSILSAWRVKSATRRAARAAAAAADANRPVSVLSNASSNGKKSTVASTTFTSRGKSPASQTRIALGPKQAQHFVTNTRRRRRANELILNTLEARRRALALHRQNTSSIFGSNPYLAFEGGVGGPDGASLSIRQQPAYETGAGDCGPACVSLSPSPVGRKTPSPAPRAARTALSDLGAARNAPSAAAAQAQRQRLLRSVNQQQLRRSSSPSQQQQKLRLKTQTQTALTKSGRQPPLAKLDQNSSDLYSSNSLSSSSLSDSSSSVSQFTQLVTSELVAPGECLLLDDERATSRATTTYQRPDQHQPTVAERTTRRQAASRSSSARSPATSRSSPTASTMRARTAAEWRQLELQEEQRELEQTSMQQQQQEASNDERSGKMRRGALGRDSIRRLRLSRALSTGRQGGQTANGGSSSSSGDSAAPPSSVVSSSESSSANQRQQAASSVRRLSAQRKQDIESNPFLNRGHFRSTSVRSVASRESLAAPNHEEQQQLQPLSAAKRSSWLFGAGRQQAGTTNGSSSAARDKSDGASSSKPARLFSLAETRRRSNLSENAERTKVSKQQEAEAKEDGIQQVERMLRQMRPNHVFTSYAKEDKSVKSQSASSRSLQNPTSGDESCSNTTTANRQQTMTSKLSSVPPSSPPPPPPRRRPPQLAASSTSAAGQERQAAPATTSGGRPRPMSPSAASPTGSGWLVREGAKSHDDLKFDAAGNKQGLAVEERWRYEKSPEHQQGQQVSERLTSERVEIMRSSGISPPPEFANSLSKSMAWRPAQSGSGDGATSQMVAGQPSTPADRVAALQRAAAQREAQREAMQDQLQQRQVGGLADQRRQQARSPVRRQQATGDTSPASRLVDSTATSQVLGGKQRTAAPSSATGVSLAATAQALPKFERTADDEFRKRVEYLRRLARSNLGEPTAAMEATRGGQQQASRPAQRHLLLATERPAQQQQSQQQTARPLSTDWRPLERLAAADRPDSPLPTTSGSTRQLSVETRDERPLLQLSQPQQHQQRPPVSPKPRLTTTGGKTGAAGNPSIEAALLADRYQTRDQLCSGGVPGAAFKWRRSNSSLASLGSNSGAVSRFTSGATLSRPQSQIAAATTSGNIRSVPTRPLSPLASSELGVCESRLNETQRVAYANLAVGGNPTTTNTTAAATTAARPPSRSSSVLSQPPSRELTSQAVVKLVVKEKSAPKLNYAFVEGRESETSSNEDKSAVGTRLIANKQQEAPRTPAAAPPTTLKELPSKTQMVSRLAQQQQLTTRTRSPIRVASPRSPEFGAMAASSNDDSAIASSVSSPSLSFMLNSAEQQKAAAAAANAAAARSASPMSGARTLLTSRPTTTTTSTGSRGQQERPATGGNLQSILRRQQQHQRRLGCESSSDSSQQAPVQQQRAGSPTESSTIKRPLGLTSSEFGQQTSQQRQQQQLSPSECTSDFRLTPFSPPASLLPSGGELATQHRQQQQQQQQLAASATSSPPKRVHFNDRTSIRSFESISSLASNSTAVPNEALRQQVGSPDSMGSGSTSRLSADSPDLRKSSGAAIYAIRGDPELELESVQQQVLPPSNSSLVAASNFHQQLMTASSHLTGQQQQQPHLQYQLPREFESQVQRQQQQQLIRMTAPPTISTNTAGQQQSAGVGQQIQYIARPTSLTSTQIVPTMVVLAGPHHQQLYQQHRQLQEDDEDPNYVLRLRQAATSGRVFNYSALPGQLPAQVAPPAIPANHNQQQLQQQRRSLEGLLNFHTEV